MISATNIRENIVRNPGKRKSHSNEMETEEQEQEYLKQLREALGDFYDMMWVKKEDEILLRYLRFTDYDIPKSVQMIHRTDNLMHKYEDQLVIPYKDVKELLEDGGTMLFKERDHLGRAVVLIRGIVWNPDSKEIDCRFRGLFYAMEELLTCPQIQKNGFVIILDCRGYTPLQTAYFLTKVSMKHVMQLIEIYTGGYPVRVGGVFTVKSTAIGAAFYNTCKYLMKKKLRERIHVSSSGPEYLQKYFAKEYLPQCLAGDVPDELCHDLTILERLRFKHNC